MTNDQHTTNGDEQARPRHFWWGRRTVSRLRRILVDTGRAIACMRRAARYCRSYRYRLWLLATLVPIQSIPPLLTPVVMQLMIDKAYPARDYRLFGWLCAATAALAIVPSLLSCISDYMMTYVNSLVEYRLSFQVLDAIQRAPQSYREGHGTGMFLERARNDVHSIPQSVTNLVPQMVTIVFTFCVAIPLMLRLDAEITLLVLAMVPLNYLITARLTHILLSLNEAGRVIEERITTFTSETIEGATIARVFSLGRYRRKKLKLLLRDRLRITFAAWRASVFWGQVASMVGTLWGMLLLCGGWYLVFINRLQLGEAVALGMYVSVLTRPFQQLAGVYQALMTNSVAARRVFEILSVQSGAGSGTPQRALAAVPRDLELRQVSFGYEEGRPCLRDLNLHLHSGQTVAVIGPSGAGKSTLMRILAGLDDRYDGLFLVNGQDLRQISHDSYLRHVSLVPQTTFFFSDSIRENVCAGDGSTSRRNLPRYARILGLNEMIDALPGGYDTRLGSGGVRLSVGQYQKLAALRAIWKHAPLLLLDEVTSSMDLDSERELLKGLVTLRPQDSVVVLVTHHIAITMEPWVDEIVVIVDGRITEQGSSAALCERRGFYYQWLSLNRNMTLDRALWNDELATRRC